jgi:hypothetical protein
VKPGDTFLIPDWAGAHLHFILSALPDGSVIVAHFTSRRAYTDDTCVIKPGEHPFVKKETIVRYDQAHICPAANLASLEGSIIRKLEPLSDELLARIQQGALSSPQTPDKIKKLIRDNNP